MPSMKYFTLALALTNVVHAEHGHHGRPMARQIAHGSLTKGLFQSGYRNTSMLPATATGSGVPEAVSASVLTTMPASNCDYWLQDIDHQGFSPFNANPTSYQVFRNVKDFGAAGDGVTDDTAAINNAISSGGRCGPVDCESSTTTPAIVYFPAGTFLVSSSIIDFYGTQLIGNPNCLPTIRASPDFTLPPGSLGVIDGDIYLGGPTLGFGSTNIFYRQIRNFVIDMTSIPSSSLVRGIHWPTAQATSLQNIVFKMSDTIGTQHRGVFVEEGSGGFMTDLVFYGGIYGAEWGNQQFTTRNLTFNNAVAAIRQVWDWGWTYKSITINNCSIGLDMTNIDSKTGLPTVGSVTFIDSSINDTPIGIASAHFSNTQPPTAGSLIVENVSFNNLNTLVLLPDDTVASGTPTSGTTTAADFGIGHTYVLTSPTASIGPINFEADIPSFNRPSSLLQGNGKFYERSKPQYAAEPPEMFYSVRNAGAKGDGVTDDTAALQHVINLAAFLHKIVFFDFGVYKITRTLRIPPGSRLVGESYSIIMSSGRFFANIRRPQPVVQLGRPGDKGSIEWSDMVVSTHGSQPGAILVEVNIESPAGVPSGLWDVHTRIGGFAGSQLQVTECPKTPEVLTPPTPVKKGCIAAFLGMHITKAAAGIYLENVWVWTADHDLDDLSNRNTQITIYTGRGLLVESKDGPVWLVGTSVEHFALYQYQFANTKNVFAGQIQTETAYYQPNPNATIPFPPVPRFHDPNFAVASAGKAGNSADGWALRVLNSENILIYGAGLYSFFENYNVSCAASNDTVYCQNSIFSIEGTSSNINIYNLNTIGSASMIDRDETSLANASDNRNVFPDTIAIFSTEFIVG